MATAPPSYFVDHKKGEVNELKAVRSGVMPINAAPM